MTTSYLLTLSCADRPGIVAAISSYLAGSGAIAQDVEITHADRPDGLVRKGRISSAACWLRPTAFIFRN